MCASLHFNVCLCANGQVMCLPVQEELVTVAAASGAGGPKANYALLRDKGSRLQRSLKGLGRKIMTAHIHTHALYPYLTNTNTHACLLIARGQAHPRADAPCTGQPGPLRPHHPFRRHRLPTTARGLPAGGCYGCRGRLHDLPAASVGDCPWHLLVCRQRPAEAHHERSEEV